MNYVTDEKQKSRILGLDSKAKQPNERIVIKRIKEYET